MRRSKVEVKKGWRTKWAHALFFTSAFALLTSAFGCASAVSAGQSAALSGGDLIRMTDDMAMKIAADPNVRAAIAAGGPLKVVVRPVENKMRATVLPEGEAVAFTGRVRNRLAKMAPGDFAWINNRDAFYQLRARELTGQDEIDPGPSPEAINPQYALTATFDSLTTENAARRSSYYLCAFRLTDLDDRQILWTAAYELKKVAKKQFLD